ncbi:OmpA family protein [Thiomicrorhabdus aquaedulcis]|uniref:OmpA family protein n=1 Tax=Thiomicrorhabdus aquaedulcis TaxID=2211106 RepID=UPI000FD7E8CB|nr:OmpA family protein [Thiomicrorhabdus aquaedulcis]
MPIPTFKLKAYILPMALAVAGLSTTACAPVQDAQQSFKDTFASDDPCSNNARNIGMVGGALLGAIVANQLGDGAGAAIVGIAAGAGIGALIGQDMDERRCELHKISQKYQIPIQAQPITLADSGLTVQEQSEFKDTDNVGLKVNLQDTGKQFLSGSATLTPQARAYFTDIAKSYSPEFTNAKDKKQHAMAFQRKILIIGHTDDVGDSNANAVLAEKRAKEVANVFASQGVPKANLHYQGAGETQPRADNRTEEGRNKNRRAEIIDLPSQNALHAYLAHRKPVLAYYRTVPTAPQTQANQTMPTTQKTPASVKKTSLIPRALLKPTTHLMPLDVAGILKVSQLIKCKPMLILARPFLKKTIWHGCRF